MIIYRDSYIFFGVAALLICSLSFATDFEYALTPKEIKAGQSAKLVLQLPQVDSELTEAEVRSRIRLIDELFTKSKDYLILKQTFEITEGRPTLTYQFTAYKPGTIVIPPIELGYQAQTFSTERQEIQIAQGRAENDNEIRPGFDEIEEPFKLPPWFWVVVWGLLAVAAVFYLVKRFYRKLPKYKAIKPAPTPNYTAPEPDIAEWLREQLEAIQRDWERGAEMGTLMDRLTFVLRKYFTKKTGGPVASWTSSEFEKRLTYDPIAVKLQEVLEFCDEHKFSRKTAQPNEFSKTLELTQHLAEKAS